MAAFIGMGAVLTVTGCTAAGNSDRADEGSASERELVSVAPAAQGPVDSLVWNLPTGEPASIDPPNAPTYSGAGVVSNLCDSLLTVDADYNLSPNLVDFEQVSPTELVYTLRADATFWDGSPVTVEDVAFSLNRAAAPTSIVAFLYANVASIGVTGAREVTVTFSQPDELFNLEMATFAGMVVQKEFTEQAGEAFGTASGGVMCSGPFELDEWLPGESITISKNESYWNPDRQPLAEQVTFTFVTDTTAMTQALNAGEIDAAHEISPAAISALDGSDAGNLYFGPSMQSMGLTVANPGGPLGDVDVRRALQIVVDREALAEIVYNGAAIPAYTVISPATWPSEVRNLYADAYSEFEEERKLNIDEATALVEASDYGGEEILLAVPAGDETLSQVGQLVQQQAQAAGLNIVIESMQPLAFAEAQYDAEKREGIHLFVGTSFNAVQDPIEPLGFSYLPDGAYNTSGFEDADVSRLLIEARATFDPEERAEMIIEAQSIYERASANIPLLNLHSVTFLNKKFAGAVTSFAYLIMPSLAYVGSAE
ncbi:ABC transporter substrate-binding protein [Okibacterium endophyticum]